MKLTIVASLCHMLAGIPEPVCHEEIVLRSEDMSLQACMFGQAIVAQWQEQSEFKQPDWVVSRYKCVFGNYLPKDAI
jgi:hypothetical protein